MNWKELYCFIVVFAVLDIYLTSISAKEKFLDARPPRNVAVCQLVRSKIAY